MIEADTLRGYRGMRHGFFTRQGGVSIGGYASLNCGFATGDKPQAVAENRMRVAQQLGIGADRLVTAKQVHGTSVAEVGAPWPGGDPPEHDALVTRVPGLALGVLTADCAPVLLADLPAGVIGAAHAGWRGALAGVIEATVAEMERLRARPDHMVAVVGPTIAQPSYEVGPEFQAEFVDTDPASASFFTASPKEGRFQFDLPEYVGARLIRAGLRRIEVMEADTRSDPARFFSHRRSTLAGETEVGRQMSAIVLMEGAT
ncbi:MAG: peptidoglycan editing factor PgeF [Alphaproteobacteria bacterium]|nr:peptidoglycan editing factor PgeF [Alphaproteobacteria bacterium]MBM4436965.1 peptidoglycan editing factor PgeF [Actinomycetota bacterium]